MAVNTIHPEYAKYAPLWRLTNSATDGEYAIKALPNCLPVQFKETEPARFEEYKERAYWLGVTGRTERAMSGMVFRKDFAYKLPVGLEYLIENFDGAGNSLEQVAKDAFSGMLRKRRHLLLAEYPRVEDGLNAATEQALGLAPFCSQYAAEALINWRFDFINGKRRLVLAVLEQSVNVSEDEFDYDMERQYLVLRLREGVYTQQLYDDANNPITDEYSPRMRGGKTFDYIPLFGVRDLTTPPLYDIARINLAHFRNTADVEDALSVISQPMLHINIGDTTQADWKDNNPSGVGFGVRRGIVTKNGSMDIVQAGESNMGRQAKIDKQEEMAALGASIIQRGGQTETAEAARLGASAESSVLDNVVNDLSEDIEAVIEAMALFVGANPEQLEFHLNTDYWEAGLSSQDLMAVIAGRQANIYAPADALNMIRSGKIALDPSRDNAAIESDIANNLLNETGIDANSATM